MTQNVLADSGLHRMQSEKKDDVKDLQKPVHSKLRKTHGYFSAQDPALHAAIEQSSQYLLGLQKDDGHWCGELGADSTLESDYVMFMHYLGDVDLDKQERLVRYVLSLQCEDGGWNIYPGGPSEINATIKAYTALRLYGMQQDDPILTNARDVILQLGGIPACNTYTTIYLALIGGIEWEDCPCIPPEILFLPDFFYINIYEMSSWSRAILVPLSIIYAHKPVHRPFPGFNMNELFPFSQGELLAGRQPQNWWDKFFMGVDSTLKALERSPVKPLRNKALRMAENWLLDHFQNSDGLAAIYPGMMNAIIALDCLGYDSDHPVFRRELGKFKELEYPTGKYLKMQPCFSPVWDTAISAFALAQAGLDVDHEALRKAGDWMVKNEVRYKGDWTVTVPGLEPGGWAFEYQNEFYPDIDDTAMVLLALDRIQTNDPEKTAAAMERGINWVLGMQSDNGGWGAFDKNNQKEILSKVPFADHNAMLDPPSVDVTGRILEMLGVRGYTADHPSVQKGLRYLRREQELDGSWYGRWGVNYIYGTWQTLRGLGALGIEETQPMVRRATTWLKSVQNDDGGWGESCLSYDDPTTKGQGVSTPSQTAWAIMAFVAAGDLQAVELHRGLRYLVETQNVDGSWDETVFTGTGFPKVFYLAYTMYRNYFPLMALGEYQRAVASI